MESQFDLHTIDSTITSRKRASWRASIRTSTVTAMKESNERPKAF